MRLNPSEYDQMRPKKRKGRGLATAPQLPLTPEHLYYTS
jgi:hypothetical protein